MQERGLEGVGMIGGCIGGVDLSMLEGFHRAHPVRPLPLRPPFSLAGIGGLCSYGAVCAILAPAPEDKAPVSGEKAANDHHHSHV